MPESSHSARAYLHTGTQNTQPEHPSAQDACGAEYAGVLAVTEPRRVSREQPHSQSMPASVTEEGSAPHASAAYARGGTQACKSRHAGAHSELDDDVKTSVSWSDF